MCEINSDDVICSVRSKHQIDILNQRQKSREIILSHNRMRTLETQVGNDVSLQVKELIFELSQKGKKLDVKALRRIKNACSKSEFIESFFKINGAFDALTNSLKSRDAEIQLEAVACFTNLACGSHKLSYRIAKAVGAYLVSFINGCSHYLQAQSAWAVKNIATDCIECYAKLKAQGVIPALLKASSSPIADVTESAVHSLSACLQYGDLDLVDIAKEEYTNTFLKLVEEQAFPLNTLREIAFLLSNVLYIAAETKYNLCNFDIKKLLKCLNELIVEENGDYLTALLLIRCLGYLTSCDWAVKCLFENPVFHETALKVLNHSSLFLKKEFIWVLTNISVSQVIDTDHILFKPILKTVEIFLNPVDSAVLTVLYYLCCTATQSENLRSAYCGLATRIQNLTSCGVSNVENASKMCLVIIQNS